MQYLQKFLSEIVRNKGFQRELWRLVDKEAHEYADQALEGRSGQPAAWEPKEFAREIPSVVRVRLIGEAMETASDEAVKFWEIDENWKDRETLRDLDKLWAGFIVQALGGEGNARKGFYAEVADRKHSQKNY